MAPISSLPASVFKMKALSVPGEVKTEVSKPALYCVMIPNILQKLNYQCPFPIDKAVFSSSSDRITSLKYRLFKSNVVKHCLSLKAPGLEENPFREYMDR
ncbi:hypothetical protein AVEN_192720-1 [Araneus ventricosus]|uniref:Uncharacterized protein n=1 Tax=Araneus ventricosus TaxID=182803 RepID=A0A4Y2JNI1_ARAVE|nr:hypothetical protein AVEN_192720-1 [Araneus ventricosus]